MKRWLEGNSIKPNNKKVITANKAILLTFPLKNLHCHNNIDTRSRIEGLRVRLGMANIILQNEARRTI